MNTFFKPSLDTPTIKIGDIKAGSIFKTNKSAEGWFLKGDSNQFVSLATGEVYYSQSDTRIDIANVLTTGESLTIIIG